MQKAFPATLAVMCIGALMMIGLSLSPPRSSAPIKPIASLAERIRDATVIAISTLAVLFIGTVLAFVIIERQQSGGKRIFRAPTHVPGWVRILSLALVMLAFVAATYTPPTEHEKPTPGPEAKGGEKKAPAESVEEPESEYAPRPEPPLVVPAKVAPWPWWKYGLIFAAIAFIAVIGVAVIGPQRTAVTPKPVASDALAMADMLSIEMVDFSDAAIEAIEEEPDAQIAVLMCYLAFLSALEMGGAPAESHYTPEECALNAEKAFKVPRRSLSDLLAAYQKAFFSTHDVTSQDKAAALASLRSLKSHIDSISVAQAASGQRG
ncbi:MAG TPA: DUF4129 domain-containing protein [Bacillota bacterium]|jgi:hypothetical protein|nr:DUF4129 domain-containing protein [Bacillota bacterium]HPZ13481.1 DUF4129 domain-containing protein [Bacillota bacterium]HQD79962.1 DUF4129 domain-containing protein [Bacillota bacterium]